MEDFTFRQRFDGWGKSCKQEKEEDASGAYLEVLLLGGLCWERQLRIVSLLLPRQNGILHLWGKGRQILQLICVQRGVLLYLLHGVVSELAPAASWLTEPSCRWRDSESGAYRPIPYLQLLLDLQAWNLEQKMVLPTANYFVDGKRGGQSMVLLDLTPITSAEPHLMQGGAICTPTYWNAWLHQLWTVVSIVRSCPGDAVMNGGLPLFTTGFTGALSIVPVGQVLSLQGVCGVPTSATNHVKPPVTIVIQQPLVSQTPLPLLMIPQLSRQQTSMSCAAAVPAGPSESSATMQSMTLHSTDRTSSGSTIKRTLDSGCPTREDSSTLLDGDTDSSTGRSRKQHRTGRCARKRRDHSLSLFSVLPWGSSRIVSEDHELGDLRLSSARNTLSMTQWGLW